MKDFIFNTGLPFNAIAFDKITDEMFLPSFSSLITQVKNNFEEMCKKKEITYENTIDEYEKMFIELNTVSYVFNLLLGANTNTEKQALAKQIMPMLSALDNDIMLHEGFFKRIQHLYTTMKEASSLTTEQKTVLGNLYIDMSRNGALLNTEQKNRLRDIDNKLSTLNLQYSDNVLASTKAFCHICSKEELDGLPDSMILQAHEAAKSKGYEDSYAFGLDMPTTMMIAKKAKNRKLREIIARANGLKSAQHDNFDNRQNIKDIISLKHERANLLGYSDYASFVLEKRMAKNTANVLNLLDTLKNAAKPKAIQEIEILKNLAREKDNILDFDSWDQNFYTEILKMKLYDIDDEMLKPYFELNNVLAGAFIVAKKLYNLDFAIRKDIPVYADNVDVYEVSENGKFIGLFYTDFFPRDGKRQGAWATICKKGHNLGISQSPHVVIVCNFTKPVGSEPSLLQFREVNTLFHEFGHALHQLLTKCTYPSVSGTSVFRDFVELPSQIMENWCFEPEALTLFAKHYQTKEVIPLDMIKKIKASQNFMEAVMTIRQLNFGYLDLAYHANINAGSFSPDEIEDKACNDTNLYPKMEGTLISTSFSHIFSGGYAAGYYSYKWAEVLDADAFEYFKKNDVFSKEIAAKFRTSILEKGGSEHPMKLYIDFAGKEPDTNALLRRSDLL